MSGRKQITNEDVKHNERMFELGREQGALEAEIAKNNLEKSHHLGLISGRAQAFSSMKLIAEFLEWKQVSQVIESEDYKLIQGVTSIDDYLEKLGFSRSAAFRNLKIARTLSPTEIQLLAGVGFTRKDLLGYASLPDEARMEIREGKIINIEKANREEIREVIEQVLQENRQVKEEATKTAEAKDRVLQRKEEMINAQEKEIIQLTTRIEEIAVPREEAAFCKLVDKIEEDALEAFREVTRLVSSEIPSKAAALHLIAILNKFRMEANYLYQEAYDMHAPADAAPEEEWQQPK